MSWYLECLDHVSLVEVEDFGPYSLVQVAYQLPVRARFYTELQRQHRETHTHRDTETYARWLHGGGACVQTIDIDIEYSSQFHERTISLRFLCGFLKP